MPKFPVVKELNFGKENKLEIYEAYSCTLIKFLMQFDTAQNCNYFATYQKKRQHKKP